MLGQRVTQVIMMMAGKLCWFQAKPCMMQTEERRLGASSCLRNEVDSWLKETPTQSLPPPCAEVTPPVGTTPLALPKSLVFSIYSCSLPSITVSGHPKAETKAEMALPPAAAHQPSSTRTEFLVSAGLPSPPLRGFPLPIPIPLTEP